MLKKVDDRERLILELELEKSRIEREKSKIILNKSFALYFCFLVLGIVGFIFKYIDSFLLNMLVIIGILILLFGTVPYVVLIRKEEKKVDDALKSLKR